MNGPATIQRFNRFELKYIIPVSYRDALIEDLRFHVSPDPRGVDGSYNVTSLYYDSPDYACYRAKIDGLKYRRKVRVRRYGGLTADPGAIAMAEIKQRINRVTAKRRIPMPLSDAYALCRGDLEKDWLDPGDAAIAQEVTYLALALRLRPVCVIGYRRRAFVGSAYEPGLRITFDQGLWSSVGSYGLSGAAARHAILPPDWLVLEVKTNNAIPAWVSNLLARHRIVLARCSKYCSGLARLIQLGAAAGVTGADLEVEFDPRPPGGTTDG